MTSSNVSNLLVQVSQIDITATSEKTTAQINTGLFAETLKNVAEVTPNKDSNPNSTDSGKQVSERTTTEKTTSLDSTQKKVEIKPTEKTTEEDDSQVVEKVEAVLEEVEKVIEAQFQVTEEDLKQAMENLGLTFIDLLNPQYLAQVVAQLSGEIDSITLVMSEDFAGVLEKVTELTNQLFEETNTSFVELKDLFVQAEPEVIDEISFDINPGIVPEVEEEYQPEEYIKEPQKAVTVEVQETIVKPEIKQEIPEENTVEDAVETDSPKQVVVENKKQESQSESDNKKETNENTLQMPKKETEESVIHRTEPMAPAHQNVELHFEPEAKVVTLPTGETVKAEEIANQLIEQAKVMTDSESTTMGMTLNPEGLGRIYLEVTQKGGEITAKIFTENDAVKTALETQMATLRTEMNQNSTKVTSIEVSVGTHEFERNLDENSGRDSKNQEQAAEHSAKRSSRINLNSLDDLSGLMTDEEMLIAQMMKDSGGTLDFMA